MRNIANPNPHGACRAEVWSKAGAWISASLALMAASTWVAAEGEPASGKLKVRACGLRVAGPGYGSEQEGLRPFNWDKGTCVALLVEKPDGGLIGFDEDKSKVASFTDNKGNNLLADKASFSSDGFSMLPEFSKDGKAAMLEVNASGVPEEGATEIRVKGVMALKIGSQKQSFQQKGIELKEGAKFTVGAYSFTITKAGKSEWGDAPLQITLETNKDMTEVAAVRFLDDQDQEIESESAGGSRMGFGDTVQVEANYDLQKKVDKVTMEITCWTDLKTREIPFEVAATVGLSK